MWTIIRYIAIALIPVWVLILFVILHIIIALSKGRKFPKRTNEPPKRKSVIKRLYWDFPKAMVNDILNRNPDAMPYYGFHLLCGEQGSGKTITLAYLLRNYKAEYPQIKVRTNFYYKYEDGHIGHWKDLVLVNNGELGQIDVLDEVQNWFSSNQSKDFPIEMLQEITQQRKQRKMIFGTAQVFARVAKPIREQVNYYYLPITLFGCLTIVRVYKPLMDDDGTMKKKRMIKMFFFVHDPEIRDSFDTYRKVKTLTKTGFTPRKWEDNNTVVNIDKNIIKGKK